jgi:hypothetical protein
MYPVDSIQPATKINDQRIVSKNQKLTFMDIWAPWELSELGEDTFSTTDIPKDPIFDLGVLYFRIDFETLKTNPVSACSLPFT